MTYNLELLWALVTRDIKSRYAQSVIGVLWGIGQPLALMFIFTLVFSRLMKTDTGGAPYPIFVYSCLVPWTFFVSALTRGTSSIELESNIIKKVAISRILFPIAAVMSTMFDFLASFAVLILMFFWYGIHWTPWLLMIIPLLLIQIVFSLGIALGLGAINCYWRDVRHGLPLLIQLWLYATPIVYALSVVPERYRRIYDVNPMVGLMDGYRNVIVFGQAPNWTLLWLAFVVTAMVFVTGYVIFRRLEGDFADVM